MSLNKLERYEEALLCYNTVIKLDFKYKNAWHNKGWSLNSLERYDESLVCYNKAIELDSKSKEAWSNKGWTLNMLERYEEALLCYNKAIELDSIFKSAWNGKGQTLLSMNRYDDALVCFNRAIKININYSYPYLGKGKYYLYKEMLEEAEMYANKALELNKGVKNTDYESFRLKAEIKMKEKDFNQAIVLLENAIVINNKKVECRLLKAIVMINLNELISSKKILDSISSKYKDHPLYLQAKLLILMNEKKYLLVIEMFETTNLIKETEEILLVIGDAYLKLNKNKESLEIYNKILKNNPNCIDALLGKASYHIVNNRNQEAIYYLNDALKINYNCKEAYLLYIKMYRPQEELIKILDCYNELIEIDSNSAELYEARGDVFNELEDYKLSLNDYEKGLELEKHNDSILKKKIETEEKLRQINEIDNDENNFPNDVKDKNDYDIIFSDNVKIDLDQIDSILSEIPKDDDINNNYLPLDNYSFGMKEAQKFIYKFLKVKNEFNKVEEDKIVDEKDLQIYNKLLKNFDDYSKEISKITTFDGSSTLNNKSIINTSIKENKELSDKLFKESKYIQNKYIINKFNKLEQRVDNLEEIFNKMTKEIDHMMKDYESIILSKISSEADKKKVEEYIIGFKQNLSNTFVVSQTISTKKIKINNSNIPVSIIGFGISLVPLLGSKLNKVVDSVWQFLNERKIKINSKKVLKIASDTTMFSQKIGCILDELFKEEKNLFIISNFDVEQSESKIPLFLRKYANFL